MILTGSRSERGKNNIKKVVKVNKTIRLKLLQIKTEKQSAKVVEVNRQLVKEEKEKDEKERVEQEFAKLAKPVFAIEKAQRM